MGSVMPGLDPGIHAFGSAHPVKRCGWPGPAMTICGTFGTPFPLNLPQVRGLTRAC